MFRIALASLVLGVGFTAAQEKDPKAPTPIVPAKLTRTEPISYEKEIAPIFVNKCQVCHSGNLLEGKLDLSTYASLMKGGKRGAAIVAGKSEESFLYKSCSQQIKPIMPPKSEDNPLTPTEVALLKGWIDQGAKPPAVDTKVKRTVVVGLPPALVKPVRAVAFSSDKTTVAAGRGNQIHLFDAKTGDFKKTLVDPTLKTPEGKTASAAHLSLVEAMAFSPDGKQLATGSFQEMTIWDIEKGTPVQRISGFADRVVAIAYSSDGKLIATGGGAPTEDGEIRVYDAAGKLAFEVKNGHSDTVFGVSFSSDGKLLATAGADKFVKVFEVPSGKFVKSFEGHTHHVMDVAWTSDNKKLVSGGADNIVKVWDYEKGEKLRDITAAQKQITRLVMVPKTSTFLTCAGDSAVKLWNADNGSSQRDFPGGKDFMYTVAVSDDGKTIATGGEEGVIRLYSSDGKLIKAMLPPGEETKPETPKKEEPKKKK
jgi:WD40 repeat protein